MEKELILKEEIQEFKLAPRYRNCRFSNYYPDKNYSLQEKSLRLLEKACYRLNHYLRSNVVKKYFLRKKSQIRGIYIDGKFGIGKTHLLSAFFHEFEGKKIYISFSDLMHNISYFGMRSFTNALKNVKLICIDEFELDDPGNTMKAGNFLRTMSAFDSFFLTTSNTVPGELGKGRFSAKSFENEIGSIASIFKNIKIDGKDYRLKGTNEDQMELYSVQREDIQVDFGELNLILGKQSQIEYRKYILSRPVWHLTNVSSFKSQDSALRFSYFIDKAYDLNYNLTLDFSGNMELFPNDFLSGPYNKKYKRCLSRLHEMGKNYINNN